MNKVLCKNCNAINTMLAINCHNCKQELIAVAIHPTTYNTTTMEAFKVLLSKPESAIDHPKHYTSSPAKCECGKTIECIQVTEHMNFNLGNAFKYLWRQGLKGDSIEDLKKAVWYIQREIARREHGGL